MFIRNFSFLALGFGILLPYGYYTAKEYLRLFHQNRCSNMINSEKPGISGRWLQSTVTSLYTPESAPAKEESAFKTLFFSAFSENAEIFVNHEKTTLERFQEELMTANFASSGTRSTIDWKELFEVPPNTEGATEAQGGIVAGVFVVTRFSKYLIRAAPAQRLNYNAFSAKIEPDKSNQPGVEGRNQLRINQLFITSLYKSPPINLVPIPHE
ncbi:hypothetical protein GALMADRAFT_135933 [Galerina marginata CBS 339.88]|uniref:Uncharacterized protein n=1 Tax=Galerina marginata (strain CBS 339.88) TaxID=685588 RepID=A0A067TEQ1_GALM3|nr:hypothetical protein GALMADRAFT_135933 [Galerina marginata CBS 339.88]